MLPRNESLVIIPAYNEEKNVGRVIREIREMGLPVDVVVIDDGSTDGTASVVMATGELVIGLPYNLGYGGALQTGFKYAVSRGYQYAIQFDADGQHDPGDIPILLAQLQEDHTDIVIGSRFLGRDGTQTGILKLLAIILFRFLIKMSTGVRITDPTSGLQGLSSRVFKYYAVMGNYPDDFPDADTLIYMLLSNCKVAEIAAHIRPRYSGKSMHAGPRTIFYMFKMIVSILVVLLRKKVKGEVVKL